MKYLLSAYCVPRIFQAFGLKDSGKKGPHAHGGLAFTEQTFPSSANTSLLFLCLLLVLVVIIVLFIYFCSSIPPCCNKSIADIFDMSHTLPFFSDSTATIRIFLSLSPPTYPLYWNLVRWPPPQRKTWSHRASARQDLECRWQDGCPGTASLKKFPVVWLSLPWRHENPSSLISEIVSLGDSGGCCAEEARVPLLWPQQPPAVQCWESPDSLSAA